MQSRLSQEISHCYAQADECERLAAAAPTANGRKNLLLVKESWLNLARNYEAVAAQAAPDLVDSRHGPGRRNG